MVCESQPVSEAIFSVRPPIGVRGSHRQGCVFEGTSQYDSGFAVVIHLRGDRGHTSSPASTCVPRSHPRCYWGVYGRLQVQYSPLWLGRSGLEQVTWRQFDKAEGTCGKRKYNKSFSIVVSRDNQPNESQFNAVNSSCYNLSCLFFNSYALT